MFTFLLLGTLISVVVGIMFSPRPKIQNAEKPNLTESDFISIDESKKIPEIFGTVKISPTIISFSNIREIPFTSKVDGGIFKSDKTMTMGYSIFASVAFAIGTEIDKLKSVYVQDDKIANIPEGNNIFSFQSAEPSSQNDGIPNGTFYTGAFQRRIENKSKPGKSVAKYYNGFQTKYDSELLKMSGYPIIYNGVSYVVIPDLYLGDMAQNMPNFSFVASRTKLFNNTILNAYSNINNGQANPAICLLYILKKFIGLNDNMINMDNFISVSEKLFNKKIGMSFTISSVDEAKNWIEEILRHISGSLNFNKKNGKYEIKLLDSDYNYNTLKSINEKEALDIKLTKSDWSEAFTSVVFGYTDPETFKSIEITKTNMASELLSNTRRVQNIKMMGISNHKTANALADLELKKYSFPRATYKMKVHISNDFNLNDVFKFSSAKLGINNIVLRVIGIGGDGFEKEYLELECIEDLFNLGNYDVVDVNNQVNFINDYSINNNIEFKNKIIYTGKDFSKSELPSLLFFVGNTDDSVINYKNYGISTQSKENIDYISYILSNQSIDENYLIDELIVQRKDFMEEISLNDRDWQTGTYLIAIGDELMSIKSLNFIDENSVSIKNIIRNINSKHSILSSQFLDAEPVFFIGTNQNNMKFLKIDNYNNSFKYNIKFFLSNRKNKTAEYIEPVGNYNNYHNKPYKVSYVFYNDILKTLEWDVSGFLNLDNSATTVNIDTVNLNNLIENTRLENQYFDLYVKYKNHIEESYSDLTINNFKLQHDKQFEYCRIYNKINGFSSDEFIYYHID